MVRPDSIACHYSQNDIARFGIDQTEQLNYIRVRWQVNVTVRPKLAAGGVQAIAPALLLESWVVRNGFEAKRQRLIEALPARTAVSKHSKHMLLNRQVMVTARHGMACRSCEP